MSIPSNTHTTHHRLKLPSCSTTSVLTLRLACTLPPLWPVCLSRVGRRRTRARRCECHRHCRSPAQRPAVQEGGQAGGQAVQEGGGPCGRRRQEAAAAGRGQGVGTGGARRQAAAGRARCRRQAQGQAGPQDPGLRVWRTWLLLLCCGCCLFFALLCKAVASTCKAVCAGCCSLL